MKLRGAPTLHVVGDSHVRTFMYIRKKQLLKRTRIRFCMVVGATAMGVINPNSKTQAGSTFTDYLQKVPRDQPVITMLGEVDCGFIIWHRSQNMGESVGDQIKKSIAGYRIFLKKIKEMGFKRIMVSSAPLPTVRDYQDGYDIRNLRGEVTATLAERMELTLKFNRKMKAICERDRLTYLDLATPILDVKRNEVKKEYLHPEKVDHHLYPPAFSKVVLKELEKLGYH